MNTTAAVLLAALALAPLQEPDSKEAMKKGLETSAAAGGFTLATLLVSPVAALVGFALVGIGCANIVPVMFTLAGRQAAMPESLAIPAVTTLGYAGVLAGPALIGFLAHGTSLVFAFLCLAVSLLAVAVTPRWLRRV